VSTRRGSQTIAVLAITAAALVACSCGASKKASPTEPASAVPPPLPGYEARLGHDVFAHYCATCHGDGGAGDGFNAYNLDPHPRDLADPVFQKKKSDADLADTIRRGGAGVGLSSLMPPWSRTLSERQVAEVVLYIRSLKKPAQ
jgi:mono/diheme cytochrome c family protein